MSAEYVEQLAKMESDYMHAGEVAGEEHQQTSTAKWLATEQASFTLTQTDSGISTVVF